jgi:hypothetical protein
VINKRANCLPMGDSRSGNTLIPAERMFMMYLRLLLPVAAVALAVGAVSDGHAQSSSSTQVRPAQMPRGACDELLRAVEIEMPSAVLGVQNAQRDISEARELCNSGQEQEGMSLLRGVLGSIYEGGGE